MSGYFGSEEHIASMSPDELRDLVRYLVKSRNDLETIIKWQDSEIHELRKKVANQAKQLKAVQMALERRNRELAHDQNEVV